MGISIWIYHRTDSGSEFGKVKCSSIFVDAAMASSKEAIRLGDGGEAQLNLGLIYTWQGKFEEVVKLYKKALETDPSLSEPYNNLGLVYLLQGKIENAIDAFKTSIELDGGEEPHTNLGLIYSWQGKLDAAIALHKEALDMAPDSTEVQINLGFAYICQDKLDKAKTMLEGALRSDPNSAEAHTNIGIIHFRQGKLADPITSYKRLMDWLRREIIWELSTINWGNMMPQLQNSKQQLMPITWRKHIPIFQW